jgi:hypothetical protein
MLQFSTQKRISAFFFTNRRIITVTTQNSGIFGQRQELSANAIN